MFTIANFEQMSWKDASLPIDLWPKPVCLCIGIFLCNKYSGKCIAEINLDTRPNGFFNTVIIQTFVVRKVSAQTTIIILSGA